MKLRTVHIWRGFCALAFCLLGSSALLAQEELAEQTPEIVSLLFKGALAESNADGDSHFIFSVAINAGDQIVATVLCEMAADGLRPIDPALTVSSPQVAGSLERWQWYNDDNPTVSDCVDYHSSLISFEAPISGDYEFVIENLASRSGPFSLEIMGSTALQSGVNLGPRGEETLVERGADKRTEVLALSAATASNALLSFRGTLVGTGGDLESERVYEILLNDGDTIVAKLTCDEYRNVRPLDPYLRVIYTDSDNHFHQWSSVDEVDGVACADSQANAIVEFTAPEDGTYSFTAVNEGANKGGYTLTVNGSSATQPASEPPLWDGEGTEVPGRWALGEFEGGDSSLIVHLVEGARIAALAICEEDDDGNRPVDPYMRVLDPNGNLLLLVDDSLDYQECDNWYSAYVEFTVNSSGSYTFEINDLVDSSAVSSLNVRALAEPNSNPYNIFVLQQLPEDLDSDVDNGDVNNGDVNNGDGDGDGDGGNGGGTSEDQSCEGATLLGKLGEIGCVYSLNTDSGQRIDVYRVDENSVGHLVLSVYINNLGDAPSSETEVASGYDGMFKVFHRPDGSLRIFGGPNPEGKEFNLVFDGVTSPNTEPTATPTPAATEVAPQFTAVHVVQAGETLYSIANLYGVSYQAIADANGIGSDYAIHTGNTLNIPAP